MPIEERPLDASIADLLAAIVIPEKDAANAAVPATTLKAWQKRIESADSTLCAQLVYVGWHLRSKGLARAGDQLIALGKAGLTREQLDAVTTAAKKELAPKSASAASLEASMQGRSPPKPSGVGLRGGKR